jgi:hypothetical protein
MFLLRGPSVVIVVIAMTLRICVIVAVHGILVYHELVLRITQPILVAIIRKNMYHYKIASLFNCLALIVTTFVIYLL